MSKSRSLLGGVLTGATDGSVSRRSILSMELLAEPCSPWRMRTGYGPVGRNAATSQARQRIQLSSSPMLINLRRRAIDPSISGRANGSIPFDRRNRAGGSVTTRQPSALISTASHS